MWYNIKIDGFPSHKISNKQQTGGTTEMTATTPLSTDYTDVVNLKGRAGDFLEGTGISIDGLRVDPIQVYEEEGVYELGFILLATATQERDNITQAKCYMVDHKTGQLRTTLTVCRLNVGRWSASKD